MGDHSDAADDYEAVRIERDGRIGRIVLDRPARLNTVTAGMLDELERAVRALDDGAARVVCVRGAGDRAFSAGADVRQLLDDDPGALSGVELSRRGQRAFAALESCDAPVVAGIDGYCLGGGMELAAAADVRIASRRSEFGQPEHDLGLLPGWGGTQRLPRLIGESRAKEIVFTADRFDAATMADYGFLAGVAEDGELDARLADLAADLAAKAPVAQRFTKRAIHRGRDDVDAGLELEAQAFGHLLGTDDASEGIAAFADGEEPDFEGR
jgi:enoyl-CoA hydratase/3-hydroxyacyl-CoA dehydrogenase